jgi:Flp pilus assembly protein TadG
MIIRKLLRDRSASSAAEFALLLPLLLLFIFGIIDAGRWMWTYNQAEKAAQMGARLAVVTAPVSSSISGSYVGACGTPGLTQGDLIPASCFTTITCTSSSCSAGTEDADAFNRILARMQDFLPQLSADNLTIEYSASGLGYAGNPNGPDVSPLVTVKIGSPTALQFTPITSFLLTSMSMPSFTTTLTAEDLSGAQSN